MSNLVLSLFPGIGLLDRAFEEAGYCVVRGPDVLWGGDVHLFHPPPGRFDGVIGGPPCQAFSTAGRMRRSKTAINLIPEYERCVSEALPVWFLMENVPTAPLPNVDGYQVWSRVFCNRWFGAEQRRKRRFSFGTMDGLSLSPVPTVFDHSQLSRPVLASDGKRAGNGTNMPGREHTLGASKQTYSQACELQGLPGDFLAHAPFTKEGRWRCVGNGVPLTMGRAIAAAVKQATT